MHVYIYIYQINQHTEQMGYHSSPLLWQWRITMSWPSAAPPKWRDESSAGTWWGRGRSSDVNKMDDRFRERFFSNCKNPCEFKDKQRLKQLQRTLGWLRCSNLGDVCFCFSYPYQACNKHVGVEDCDPLPPPEWQRFCRHSQVKSTQSH